MIRNLRRSFSILALAVALVGTLLLSSGAAQARSARQTPLAPSTVAAIKALPHPYLRTYCGGPLFVGPFARMTLSGHAVIVAESGCALGTSGSPQETSAYGWKGGKLTRLYYLDRGAPRHFGAHDKIWTVELSFVKTSANSVRLTYGGYSPSDAMCCPSHLYKRTETLGWTTVNRGHFTQTRP